MTTTAAQQTSRLRLPAFANANRAQRPLSRGTCLLIAAVVSLTMWAGLVELVIALLAA